MSVLLADVPATRQGTNRDPSAVAAWALRHASGPPTIWAATGLEDSDAIAAWVAGVLVGSCWFATLLYSELAEL